MLRLRPIALAVAAAALFLSLPGAGHAAEYRDNMPEVLGQDEAVDRQQLTPPPAQVRRAFANAYQAQGGPRIAVFWNRTFSDRLSQWVAEGRLLLTREGQAAVDLRSDAERDLQGTVEGDQTATAAVQRNVRDGGGGDRLPALAAAEFETAFAAPMLQAGVQLVDRAAIMRMTDSDLARSAGRSRMADAQRVEAEALKGFADYLAEIVLLPDTRAPVGRSVRITVKRIPDGVLVADVVAVPQADTAKTTWVAGPDGYVKVGADDPASASALGRTAALQTMQALTDAWR